MPGNLFVITQEQNRALFTKAEKARERVEKLEKELQRARARRNAIALELRRLGLSYKDVGDIVGVSPPAVLKLETQHTK